MYDKLLKLKENKKWLYYLFFIPAAVLAVLEIYNKYLANSAKNTVKDAEKKDNDLEKKQIKAEQAAEFHEEEAENIKKNINSQKTDKNWHLK